MFNHPYVPFLFSLERPGRYVGGEFGSVVDQGSADLQVLLAFPDSYEIGMSHMGLSILYEVINGMSGLRAERVFMPWPDLEKELRERQVPLVSLESARTIRDFDLVGFSLQFELNYTNILAMLDLGRVPRRAKNRREDDPIILVGGPAAVHCEPISPFVDLCFAGEAEGELPGLLEEMRTAKAQGWDREAVIERASEHPAVFAPNRLRRRTESQTGRLVVDMGEKPVATRTHVGNLEDHPTGLGPVPTVTAVFDRFSMEVARGCTAGCRFCQAGFLYRPVRERGLENTLAGVDRAVTCLGYDEISVASLSTADHSRVEEIIQGLGEVCTPRRVSLSVPSLRAYGLSEKTVEVLGRLRATGVTLAPEAGSQRLRDAINKNITENDLMEAAARFFERGFSRIKLYFMIGLPGENDDDLREIVELAVRLRDRGRRHLKGRPPVINVSISTFVPKPFTPFEREEMIGISEIERRQSLLQDLGRARRIEVRVHNPRLSVLEGVFSRGDRKLADILERAYELGARFDGWDDMFRADAWNSALSPETCEQYLAEIPQTARLPWDHVDVGIKSSFLAEEREKAERNETTAPCGRFSSDSDTKEQVVCHACGMKCRPQSLPLRSRRESSPRALGNGKAVPKRTARPLPPAGASQDRAYQTLRLYYAKWGRQAFVGHLDTMRHVERSLRRAGIEMFYTQGFHPKPKVTSAPPLPLGTIGLSEPVDVALVDPPEIEELLERLGRATPIDFRFHRARVLGESDKSIGKSLRAASYVSLIPLDRETVLRGMERLRSSTSWEVERVRKGPKKRVDLRPFIVDMDVIRVSGEELMLPEVSDRTPLAFTLAIPGSGGARPAEIIEAVCGARVDTAWTVRRQFVFD